MPNYTVEALRTIRVIQRTHEKAGHSVQEEQMRKIGDQVEAMQAELAALKETARPVVAWAKQRMYGIDLPGWNHPGAESTAYLTSAQLDALAALVGEEGR